VGAIVGAYKSTTARLINGLQRKTGAPVWERNYYERIIRDEAELRRIRVYILNNPLKWELDLEKPA
jgi:REP element-mobilizing transposase RayT